jgi:hypothetical protein
MIVAEKMTSIEKIVIHDLAKPVLTDIQHDALMMTKDMMVDFSVEGILADARRKTQLDDFGADDFLRRLQLLCDEWGGDDGLTNIGKLSLRNKLLLFARNRLLIHDLLKRHPEIHDEKIEQPIIVCGLPRSGTTHLVNLLAADSRLRSLPLWESYEPVLSPLEKADENGVDPRYKRCQKQWDMAQQITPLLAAMHPMNPEHIHEELELMGPDFASYNFEWLAMSPCWRDDYYRHDQTPHYEYMKTALKLLQWQDKRAGKQKARWVLKCPQHLEQLLVLKKVFPDATVVITHRDPVSVIQSAITMLAYGQRINRKQVQMHALVNYWSDRIEYLLRACVRDRSAIADTCSIDVLFDVFMADDMAMVRRIYEKSGLPMTGESEKQLQDFIANHPRGKYGQVQYNLKGDFGVEPEILRERFRFYFDAFSVPEERTAKT